MHHKLDLDSRSVTHKHSRPSARALLPQGRTYALTPIRNSKKPPGRSQQHSKDFPLSPYISRLKKSKVSFFSSFLVPPHQTHENIFSWNCKTTENKFTQIRPCVVIKPDLLDGSQLFGFCDGDNKDSAGRLAGQFQEIVEKTPKVCRVGRRWLGLVYKETLASLKSTDFVFTPHELCMVLLRKKKLKIFNIGTCGVLIGKKTFKGWEGDLVKVSSEVWLEEKDKIVVLGNSGLLAGASSSDIMKVAGNYWEMKNPNIACWEIVDLVDSLSCPLCLVIFLS